ncbi:copper resistance protein CopA, partial [Stenotrophomonas koreensis]
MSDDTLHDARSVVSRRRFVQGLGFAGLVAGTGLWRLPAAQARQVSFPVPELRGATQHLHIGELPVNFTGKARTAITVNQSLPAPVLRWREGETVNLHVHNALRDDVSSIHWHGLLLPANMDGVPGLSFDGIAPGQAYHYRFELRQNGTYWYHSHSLFQEQAGLYGAIVIDPIAPPPYRFDREHVLLLSDWTDLDGAALYRRMKKMAMHDNTYQQTLGELVRDARRDGLRATLAERAQWARMRMTPTDLSDINANTYTYLLNGHTPAANWTGLFRPGERVLLRLINGSAMTHFDIRIPGLKLTVVAADGQYVHPVSVDELRIATAETFDVLVEPTGQDAFTVFAQDMGRTGFACGTLATRPGLAAVVPALDRRPLLSMADMAHDHGSGHGSGYGAASTAAAHAGHAMPADPHAAHAGHGRAAAPVNHPASETGSPVVDMQSSPSGPRLEDPGIGLRDNGRRVLAYADLHSLFDDPDGREPGAANEPARTG